MKSNNFDSSRAPQAVRLAQRSGRAPGHEAGGFLKLTDARILTLEYQMNPHATIRGYEGHAVRFRALGPRPDKGRAGCSKCSRSALLAAKQAQKFDESLTKAHKGNTGVL